MLTIIYPKLRVPSGNKHYSERILKGLLEANYPFKSFGVRKVEFSIAGKPYGGIVSQRFGLRVHGNFDHPIHALVPELSPEGVDIVTIHDIIPFLQPSNFIKGRYDKSAYRMMFNRALSAKILVVSTRQVKTELMENLNIPEDRLRVIYEGIDVSKFFRDSNSPYPDNGKIHLVTVGDFNPRKRFDLLYEIVAGQKDMELYHIGPTNAWTERAKKLGELAIRSGNIFQLGKLDFTALRRYLSNADLFVYISDAEGFGLPPIEALACGTNVVLNDLPIFKETVGGYGFLSSIEKFGETIQFALKNRRDPEILRTRSMEFATEREIKELISLYEEFNDHKD